MQRIFKKIFSSDLVIFFILVVICLFFSIMNPKAFLTISNMFTIIRQVSMLGIAAVGMMIVLIVGGFDLSIGSVQGFAGIMVGSLMVNQGLPISVAILITLCLGAVIGFTNGIIITRLNVNPFITTLGTMTIIKGISFEYTGAYPVYGFNEAFRMLGQGYIARVVPIPVIIMFIIFIIGVIIMNKTYLGRYFYSVGGNEEASRLSGINVKVVKLMAFVICGLLATLAGLILASRLNSGQPAAGAGFEFDVITACILGGVSLKGGEGKLFGVLTGVLIMGVLSNGMILINISEYYQLIVKGTVLIAAVAIDGIKHQKR